MKMKALDHDILRLAIPSIVSNITVPLLGLVDLTIVGHMGSERYIAAIAVGTMIFNVLYWMMGFLRMGTSGMTAQAFGRGDAGAIRYLLRRALLLAFSIAALFLLMQYPLRWLALWVIGPSESVRPLVTTYFNIVIWGAPAMLGIYGLTGWCVGMQTTRIPMWVAIFQNVVNIVASLSFVLALHMQIAGVALGTLVAQWSGFMLALFMVLRHLKRLHLTPPSTVRQAHHSTFMAQSDLDIFLRTLCLIAVNLAFTSFGARQGDLLLAVNTLLITFFTIFSYVMDGFAFAGEALSGKLFGADDSRGLRQLVGRLFRWGWSLAVLFTVVYAVGGQGLLRLITSDGGVVAAAHSYLPWACLIPLAGVAAFIYDGIFIGLTLTRGMLLSSVVAAGSFFLIYLLLGAHMGNHALWMAFLCYLAMRGIMQALIGKKLRCRLLSCKNQ